MKYCKVCGAVISDDACFCTSCGVEVDGTEVSVEREFVVAKNSDIKGRNFVLCLVFTLITCGIYSIYWMIKLNGECLKLAEEKGVSGGLVVLFNLLTCGLYSYFWAYKMGECVDKINNKSGFSGYLYIVLAVLGLGIVNMALMQDTINNVVDKGEY